MSTQQPEALETKSPAPAARHATFIRVGDAVPMKCPNSSCSSCNGQLYHCPYCQSSLSFFTEKDVLAHLDSLHLPLGVQCKDFLIVPCYQKCSTTAQPAGHYHCALCTTLVVGKSHFHAHVQQHLIEKKKNKKLDNKPDPDHPPYLLYKDDKIELCKDGCEIDLEENSEKSGKGHFHCPACKRGKTNKSTMISHLQKCVDLQSNKMSTILAHETRKPSQNPTEDFPMWHKSIVRTSLGIPLKRCEQTDCCENQFHCPLCVYVNGQAMKTDEIQGHFKIHFRQPVFHKGYTCLTCQLDCRKDGTQTPPHYHCGYCGLIDNNNDHYRVHLYLCQRLNKTQPQQETSETDSSLTKTDKNLLKTVDNTCSVLKTDDNTCSLLKTDDNTCSLVKTDDNTCSLLKTDDNTCSLLKTDDNTSGLLKTDDNTCSVLKTDDNTSSVLKTDDNTCSVLKTDDNTCSVLKTDDNTCIFLKTDINLLNAGDGSSTKTQNMLSKTDDISAEKDSNLTKTDAVSLSKTDEDNLMKIDDDSLIKTNDSLMKTNDDSLMKTNDNNLMKTNDDSLVKKDHHLMKINDNNLMKTNDDNFMQINEDNLMKTNDDSLMKTNDDSLMKTEDNNLMNTNDDSLMETDEDSLIKIGNSMLNAGDGSCSKTDNILFQSVDDSLSNTDNSFSKTDDNLSDADYDGISKTENKKSDNPIMSGRAGILSLSDPPEEPGWLDLYYGDDAPGIVVPNQANPVSSLTVQKTLTSAPERDSVSRLQEGQLNDTERPEEIHDDQSLGHLMKNELASGNSEFQMFETVSATFSQVFINAFDFASKETVEELFINVAGASSVDFISSPGIDSNNPVYCIQGSLTGVLQSEKALYEELKARNELVASILPKPHLSSPSEKTLGGKREVKQKTMSTSVSCQENLPSIPQPLITPTVSLSVNALNANAQQVAAPFTAPRSLDLQSVPVNLMSTETSVIVPINIPLVHQTYVPPTVPLFSTTTPIAGAPLFVPTNLPSLPLNLMPMKTSVILSNNAPFIPQTVVPLTMLSSSKDNSLNPITQLPFKESSIGSSKTQPPNATLVTTPSQNPGKAEAAQKTDSSCLPQDKKPPKKKKTDFDRWLSVMKKTISTDSNDFDKFIKHSAVKQRGVFPTKLFSKADARSIPNVSNKHGHIVLQTKGIKRVSDELEETFACKKRASGNPETFTPTGMTDVSVKPQIEDSSFREVIGEKGKSDSVNSPHVQLKPVPLTINSKLKSLLNASKASMDDIKTEPLAISIATSATSGSSNSKTQTFLIIPSQQGKPEASGPLKNDIQLLCRTPQYINKHKSELELLIEKYGPRFLTCVAVENSNRYKDMMCPICFEKFWLASYFLAHMMMVHIKFQCPECPGVFTRSHSLEEHLSQGHTSSGEDQLLTPLHCGDCNLEFDSRRNLDDHQTAKHTYNPLCVLCAPNKAFESHYKLLKHIGRVHCGKKMGIPCDTCGIFYTYKDLRKHRTSHGHVDVSNSVGCRKSGKAYKNIYSLQNRPETHKPIEERSYNLTCQYCDKRFRDDANLQDHIDVHHSGQKPHKCLICGQTFATVSILCAHRFAEHTKRAVIICKVCEKTFQTNKSLTKHLLTHGKHSCPHCHKSFGVKTLLKHHLKSCNHCFGGPGSGNQAVGKKDRMTNSSTKFKTTSSSSKTPKSSSKKTSHS